MPVIFDEVTAVVEPDRTARAEEPPPDRSTCCDPEPRAIRRELRRLARRALRLRAD